MRNLPLVLWFALGACETSPSQHGTSPVVAPVGNDADAEARASAVLIPSVVATATPAVSASTARVPFLASSYCSVLTEIARATGVIASDGQERAQLASPVGDEPKRPFEDQRPGLVVPPGFSTCTLELTTKATLNGHYQYRCRQAFADAAEASAAFLEQGHVFKKCLKGSKTVAADSWVELGRFNSGCSLKRESTVVSLLCGRSWAN